MRDQGRVPTLEKGLLKLNVDPSAPKPKPPLPYAETYRGKREEHSEEETALLCANGDAAVAAAERGDLVEAERRYRAELARREAAYGPDHPDTLIAGNNLAVLLIRQGDPREANRLFRRSLEGTASPVPKAFSTQKCLDHDSDRAFRRNGSQSGPE